MGLILNTVLLIDYRIRGLGQFLKLVAKKAMVDGFEINLDNVANVPTEKLGNNYVEFKSFLEMYNRKILVLDLHDDVKNIPKRIIINKYLLDLIHKIEFEDSSFGKILYKNEFGNHGFIFTFMSGFKSIVIKNSAKKLNNLTEFVKKLIKEKRIPKINTDLTWYEGE